MIGQALGRYRIVDKLGEGGMGVVYKARDTDLDRFVAIKVLPPERVADRERKRRFVQEAKAASSLNHPNIVAIHDIAADDGVDFIVMEYVEGRTLDQVIGRKALRLHEALDYAAQIADGVARAHAAGIAHRDLKPSNIMITTDARVKILDFGLAKLTEAVEADTRGLTQVAVAPDQSRTAEGVIVGTVATCRPNRRKGRRSTRARTSSRSARCCTRC